MGETTSRRKHSKAVERTNERVPAPVTENIKQEPSRGALVPGASAPINVSTLASVESLRYTIERCAQRERERGTLASTIFSHNGGVSCRENYDTVSSMQKKKKEREKIKIKKNRNRIRVGRRAVSFLAFHAISTGNELRHISAKRI